VIIVKVLKDDGVDIILRREKPSNVLPFGMILHLPEEGLDYNRLFGRIADDKDIEEEKIK